MIFDPGSTFRSLASNSACNLRLILVIGGGKGIISGVFPTGIHRYHVCVCVSVTGDKHGQLYILPWFVQYSHFSLLTFYFVVVVVVMHYDGFYLYFYPMLL